MAKNTAKSKGYRKTVEKKPYLSKRDIILLCVGVVAVAVAAFFLFRIDDGALKVKEGKVMTDGDNWLIVNGSNARGGVRYFKLGEVGEIDGYNRTVQFISGDDNIPEYLYSPATEGNQVGSITVTTSHNGAEALAKYARAALESIDGNKMGELQSAEIGGRKVSYYIYTTERAQGDVTNNAANTSAAESNTVSDDQSASKGEAAGDDQSASKGESTEKTADAPTEANRFMKTVVGYEDATHDSCVVIHITSNADAAETMMADEELMGVLESALATVTLEEK